MLLFVGLKIVPGCYHCEQINVGAVIVNRRYDSSVFD